MPAIVKHKLARPFTRLMQENCAKNMIVWLRPKTQFQCVDVLSTSGAIYYGLRKNTNIRVLWNWHTKVFVTNKIFESSFRRFSFFRMFVNISPNKKIFGRRLFYSAKDFFSSEIFTKILNFFLRIFCSAEDLFVRYWHFLFVLTFFFFGIKSENGSKCSWISPNFRINLRML